MTEANTELASPTRRHAWATDPRRVSRLLAINRAIVSTLDFNELLHVVIEKTAAFTEADCCVLLLGDGSGRVKVAASVGLAAERVAQFSAPLDEKLDQAIHGLSDGGARAWVNVPVMNHGSVEGVLAVCWAGELEVGSEEQFLLSALADMAAIALGHAAGYEKLYRSRDELLQQLERKTALLEAVMQAMPVGMMIAQAPADGRVWVNCEVDRIFQTTLSSRLQPQPADELKLLAPDGRPCPGPDRPTFRALAGEAIHGKAFRFERADGSTGIAEVSSAPVLGAGGEVTAAVTVFQDITERMAQEEQRAALLATNRSALEQLEKVALKEQAARARAEEADRRKDEFLAMLAHELRNPLMALSNALQLRDRGESGAGPKARMLRETCTRQLANLTRMVDDLLDVSRVSSSRVELRKRTVVLTEIIDSALQVARVGLDARGHDLSVDLPAEPCFVNADPTRLEQVLCNLLNNAAKYTPVGGEVCLRVAREERDGAPWIAIRVKDNGQGIAPQMLEQVFELFVQVDRSLDRAQGGLGIGLTLVKGLVELHGGFVTALSAGPGKGSEFIVRLPLTAAPPAAEPAVEPPAPLDRQRVLIVEDSDDNRETLKMLFEELGHEVEVASDGLEGVTKMLAIRPDVALVDLGLPGIDGYEVARRVRAAPGGESLYLVALTGYGGPEAQAKALSAGFNRHAAKPIDIDNLLGLLTKK